MLIAFGVKPGGTWTDHWQVCLSVANWERMLRDWGTKKLENYAPDNFVNKLNP